MRRAIIIAALFISLPAATGQETPQVVISELLPDPGEGREFIELWNQGEANVNLSGWQIMDAAGATFTFTDLTLAAGKRVVVWGGGESDATGPAWSKSTVWNNGGDTATLTDGLQVIDALTYGSGGEPAPPTGKSLALVDELWESATPTPGLAPGESGGSVSATVQNVAPWSTFAAAPESVEPGQEIAVTFEVGDDNGVDDIAQWHLYSGDDLARSETSGGQFGHNLTSPNSGLWQLRVLAIDHSGLSNNTWLNITVASYGFTVTLPAQGISFPNLSPGASNVTASAPFTLRNEAPNSAIPRIDVSNFQGPSAIEVAGNLSIGYGDAGSQSWVNYAGPLTPLPAIAPGAEVSVWLRIDHVPIPLPAGSYGTSFTVVA